MLEMSFSAAVIGMGDRFFATICNTIQEWRRGARVRQGLNAMQNEKSTGALEVLP